MSPCFSPLIYLFALTGSRLSLTGQSTLIYSLLYTLLYRGCIFLGARFLSLYGGDLAAAKECSGSRTSVYTLLYRKRVSPYPVVFLPSLIYYMSFFSVACSPCFESMQGKFGGDMWWCLGAIVERIWGMKRGKVRLAKVSSVEARYDW